MKQVDDGRRGEVENRRADNHRNDDDGQATTQLSKMVEQRHASRSDGHYCSPPFRIRCPCGRGVLGLDGIGSGSLRSIVPGSALRFRRATAGATRV